MVQKVIKYGNSSAVVIAADLAQRYGLTAGSFVKVIEENGRLVLSPVEVVPRLSESEREFVDDLHAKRETVFKRLGE